MRFNYNFQQTKVSMPSWLADAFRSCLLNILVQSLSFVADHSSIVDCIMLVKKYKLHPFLFEFILVFYISINLVTILARTSFT